MTQLYEGIATKFTTHHTKSVCGFGMEFIHLNLQAEFRGITQPFYDCCSSLEAEIMADKYPSHPLYRYTQNHDPNVDPMALSYCQEPLCHIIESWDKPSIHNQQMLWRFPCILELCTPLPYITITFK